MIEASRHHVAALAAIHIASFPAADSWHERAIADILAMPGVFGFIDPRGGMILARSAGGETEILTLAVTPAMRRQGIGRALLERVAADRNGMPLFLEVGAENSSALALYGSAGFAECGRRPAYYGPGRDALLLRR